MVSTYIWVDTIASSDGVRKVCCPDGYIKTPTSAEQPAPVSNHACVGKSWADRLLDLLKIGIGLANLIVGFLKH